MGSQLGIGLCGVRLSLWSSSMDNSAYEHDLRHYNNNTKDAEATKETPLSEEEIKAEKKIIYKNVLLISVSFLLLFVAFESMSKLQSSINMVNNLGTWANATVYASLILSCMFMPGILIKKLKVKWTLVVYIFSTSVLSSGKTEVYTELSDAAMARCGSAYCPAQLAVSSNITSEPTTGVNETAGHAENDNFKTDITKIYIIAGIYLACSFSVAVIIALFVDPLTRFGEDERQEGRPTLTGKELLVATFRHMKKKKQILIIPLTFWSGIEQGFFGADFTAGFVTCAYGVHIVGRVLIVFGICDALASVGFGFVIKRVGRVPIFILGACINLSVIIVMLSWTPTASSVAVVYVLAAPWGIGDAIWQTQINALYGVLFASDEEAAFSNYRLWESMGFLLAFVTQASGVCVMPKLILALFLLAFAMVGYLMLELLERKEARSSHTN